MKKLTLLLIILVSSNLFSQSGWQVVYGGDSYGLYYNSVHFANDQTGYLMGNRFYKKTTDGGNSWVRTDSVGNSIYHFLNSETGWVYDYSGLYYTSSGGNNWINLNSTLNTNSLFFLDINTGFSCGNNGSINKTTNRGINWVTMSSGVPDKLNAIYFTSTNNGYCAGDWGTILTTTNGGVNWIKFTDVNIGFFSEIIFVNQQTGFVCGTGGTIFRTTNAGLNWQGVFTNSSANFSSINFVNTNTGYVFGSFGEILKTTNSGILWNTFTNTAYIGNIYSASITPNGSMWLAADTGSVYNSTNGGIIWQLKLKQFIVYKDLNSVQFTNNLTGWVCGNTGTLLKSTNGGANWQFKNFNTTYNLKSLLFLNNNTGYVCGGNGYAFGVIYKTTNEGLSWQTVYQDSFSLNSIYFLNDNSGWAVGTLGSILKTTNAGTNWITYRHQFFTSSLNDVWFTNENTGYLSRTSIFKSINGGANWISILNSVSPNSIQFINTNTGYFSNTSSNCIVYKTENAGINWTQYPTGTGNANSLYFITDTKGWIAGSNIKYTSNGGINWQIQPVQGNLANLNSIYFINENNGWAVGFLGTILKTGTGGIGITTISAELPKQFNLFQNYPNPFNPVTKIRFDIVLDSRIRGNDNVFLKIYDILGREVATIVNEQLKPGTFEVDWDATNYPSGVYFYSLITNNFTQTRKMVVIK